MHSPIETEPFIRNLPKVELHVHIEGTLTPQLRWNLAKKNDVKLPYETFEDLKASYATMYNHRKELQGDNGLPSFLEAYYGGMEVLRTESDFYDLAKQYFDKAASMNVRYCEPFFDIQAHTRRGVPISAVMEGLERARNDAASRLGLECNWTLCFLRDMEIESAQEAYVLCRPYQKRVFNAIGLDSNEYDRPATLFDSIFRQARADGLHVTAHCDFGQKSSLEHIRQVVSEVADTGLDRLDHGLNAAEKPELMNMIAERDLGMTLCPHAYNRRNPPGYVFPLIRKLFDAGIKITINSDDPTYMHDMWISENLQLARTQTPFSNAEIVQLQKNAIDMSWAPSETKGRLLQELSDFAMLHGVSK